MTKMNRLYLMSAEDFDEVKIPHQKPGKCHNTTQGWTGMYISVVPSLSVKLIKNSLQNLPI